MKANKIIIELPKKLTKKQMREAKEKEEQLRRNCNGVYGSIH